MTTHTHIHAHTLIEINSYIKNIVFHFSWCFMGTILVYMCMWYACMYVWVLAVYVGRTCMCERERAHMHSLKPEVEYAHTEIKIYSLFLLGLHDYLSKECLWFPSQRVGSSMARIVQLAFFSVHLWSFSLRLLSIQSISGKYIKLLNLTERFFCLFVCLILVFFFTRVHNMTTLWYG